MIKRYLEKTISEDLKEKMVFITGPRQVGKTTLAKEIGKTLFRIDTCISTGTTGKIERFY